MLLRRPIAAIILVLAVFIFGGITLQRLSIELLPDVARPTILVSTTYRGAPATEIELRVNEPLEQLLSSVRNLKGIEALSRQGQGLIYLHFEWGTNMDLAFLNVREKLDQGSNLIPEEADRPQLIYSSASEEPIAVIGLQLKDRSNSEFDNKLELKRWAEQVFARRLEQEEGIAQAILVGDIKPEIQIQFDPKQLERFEITQAQLSSTIRNANLFSSGGDLRDGWYKYSLKIESRINKIDDIRAIPVKTLASGRVLQLEDIAEIAIAEADPTSFALLGNEDILFVLIKKEFGTNTVEVFDLLQNKLAEVRQENPNISIEVVSEDATYIDNSISNLLQTLLIGGALAFIVLFLFLDDVRTPFTIGISIPVSIFLTFLVMFLFDIQLNIISLSGLTLGIGLLLDNSIVVLENINRYREQGLDIYEACIKGTKEIALAITASTFTTISVFVPLLFLGGFEGAFFRDLAATLSISLLSSLIVALLILPVFVAQVSKSTKGGTSGIILKLLNNIISTYERSLAKFSKHPVIGLFLAIGLFLGAVWLFMITPKQALPEDRPEQAEYVVTLPGNTSLRAAKDAALTINQFMDEQDIGEEDPFILGGYTDNTDLSSIAEEGLNKFTLAVPINGFEGEAEATRFFDSIVEVFVDWKYEKKDVGSLNFANTSNRVPVELSLIGLDRSLTERVGTELESYLQQTFEGITLLQKYPQKVKAYNISFKDDELLRYEITVDEVQGFLESQTRGEFVTNWNQQDEQLGIWLVGNSADITDPTELILEISNRFIPFSYVADIEVRDEAEQIERIAQSAVLTYNTNLTSVDWWWRGEEFQEQVSQFIQQTGIEIEINGTALEVNELIKDLGLLLLISVILIYLILAIQYENLLYPFIIILAIPFAWIGSISALYITATSLNALSFMGILILTGIAVNDSILKVDFMKRYYEDTGDLDSAVRQAGINRFRPVVMTSLTTILGLIPMVLPFGDGYVLRQSLAIALMGGMVTSTLLTLYLIPTIYRWIELAKKSRKLARI